MSTGTPSTNEAPAPATTTEYLLGRLDGKMDLVIAKLDGHDRRISAVEKRQWWATGAAAVAGAVISKVIPFAQIIGLH